MKIKCGNCKKSFDTEKHGDFCPHCGMFINENYAAGKVTKKQWAKTEGEELQEKKGKKKAKPKVWVYIVVMVLLILIPVVMSPISSLLAKSAYEKNRGGVREAEYYEIGETIDVMGHQVTITEIRWQDETKSYAKVEGQKLLEIDYDVKAEGSVVLDAVSNVYLKVDGQYLKASEMDAVKGTKYSYYDNSITDRYGSFGFVVPDDAQSVELIIQIYSDTLKSKAKLIGNYAIEIDR